MRLGFDLQNLLLRSFLSGPIKMRDPETGKYVAPTEAGRRQQYLDKMTGGAEVTTLRQLVERCLDDDPDERPLIQEVNEKIGPIMVSVLLHYTILAKIFYIMCEI